MGLSHEAMIEILGVLAEQQEAEEKRLADQRDRTRKHRAKRYGNVTVTGVSHDGNAASAHIEHARTHVEDNLKPIDSLDLENKKAVRRVASRLDAVREELATVLDAEHVEAIIEHRKNKRSPLTVRAAKLLAREFGACPDANAAADMMILNSWQGFNHNWLNGRANGHHDPPASQAPAVRIGTAREYIAERLARDGARD
jgi:hypothetical protein